MLESLKKDVVQIAKEHRRTDYANICPETSVPGIKKQAM